MKPDVPPYYTSLKPFAGMFTEGTPCLMYHKLGPRPSRVRLKGLYVSARLFARQLSELRKAGYTSASPGEPAGRDGKRIVLTFDDGFASVHRHGLEPLARHGFRAIEFLVADRLGFYNEWEIQQGEAREPLMDMNQAREWLAAGHEIGSHTLTHPFLTQIKVSQAREEISDSKKKLEDLFGRPVRHFCYPYGDWNPAVRDLVIEAGYETACTTDFGVNTDDVSRFELRRITARYQSISFKAIKSRIARLARG